MANALPSWAADLAEQYYGGTLIEFIIYGNINDKVESGEPGNRAYHSLRDFLAKKLFPRRDAVIFYDPSNGVSFRDQETYPDFTRVVQGVDRSRGTNYATTGTPRDANRALYLVEKFMRAKVDPRGGNKPKSVALIIEYADMVLPAGDPSHISPSVQSTLVTLLRWSKDPVFLEANLTVVLIAENLAGLNPVLVESPYIGRVEIQLPGDDERLHYLEHRFEQHPELNELCEIDVQRFAKLTGGLSRVNLNHITSQARANKFKITSDFVGKMKKELIEKECFGMLEFLRSDYGLDTVCGHEPQKEWLRADARLIKENKTDALPMGYLICGPVGTGKSFLAQCYTYDIGVPCVRLKNFRSQWYGQTESNWQKILSVLKATGPVGVVIDEADAAVGDRSSGHEVSNRVFSMLATEMGDTRNRGHILWFLLTSRPDLLPVDIKRQGRAEVHIPLFYPDSPDERRDMREILIKKCKLEVDDEALEVDVALIGEQSWGKAEPVLDEDEDEDEHEHAHPTYPDDDPRNVIQYMEEAGLSGAEIESILIRAKRRAYLNDRTTISKSDLHDEAAAYIPNLSKREIELQILAAVLECSDKRFLPDRLRKLDRGRVRFRLREILRAMTTHSDIRTGPPSS